MTVYDPSMLAYFERLDRQRFRATSAVEGAWNVAEQHIAPALGLLAHAIESDRDARRDDAHTLVLGRISYDILGTLPIDDVEIGIRMLRPGRTIELVEASLSHDGRAAVLARAWLMRTADTTSLAGSALPPMPGVQELEPWDPREVWPGEFVRSVEVRREQDEPGRARFWLRPRIPLLLGEEVSATARMLGAVDITNGMTVRVSPAEALFPNLDLTAHLFAQPTGAWIGCDTTVSFGAGAIGLTHTVLHDATGPIGTAQQTLTVRPRIGR